MQDKNMITTRISGKFCGNIADAADREMTTQLVRQIAQTVISTHAADRMAQKGVTGREIEICLTYGSVIEVHDEAGEWRAVIRHAFGMPKVAVYVVIGIMTGTIVTCWKNAGSDNHATLNTLAYDRVKLSNILGRS